MTRRHLKINLIAGLLILAGMPLCHAQMYTRLPNVNPTTGLWDGYSGPYSYDGGGYSGSGYPFYQAYPVPYRSQSYQSGPYRYRQTVTPYSYMTTCGVNTYRNTTFHPSVQTFQYHGPTRSHR